MLRSSLPRESWNLPCPQSPVAILKHLGNHISSDLSCSSPPILTSQIQQTVIKGWLDPVVASKIHFTKTTEDMEAFIPKENIPKELGGSEDWTYTYVEPIPDENAPIEDEARRNMLLSTRGEQIHKYEAATRAWIASSETGESAVAERRAIARELATGYWELDKYLRARTVYDRTGVLLPNGEVNFYSYKKEKAGAVETSEDDID